MVERETPTGQLRQPITPADRIRAARELFVIAAKAVIAIGDGTWKPDDLKTHLKIKGESDAEFFEVRHHRVGSDELKVWAWNMHYATIVVLATEVDAALKESIGKHILQDPERERRAARAVMYMIRCSVAHGPIRPVWECSPGYAKVWDVPSAGLSVDLTNLNGQRVRADIHGGWTGFLKLVEYCLQQVS
jgi:hypothetical protein